MTFNLKQLDDFRKEIMHLERPNRVKFCGYEKAATAMNLILEELSELQRGIAEEDCIQIADAVADLIVVVTQLSYVCGIDIDAVLAEVHRSNMSKAGGHFDDAGKYVKPPTYQPAVLVDVLYGEQIQKLPKER